MEFHFEFCDHSEVAATSTQGPKQVRVLLGIGVYQRTVRCHESEALDVIAGQSKSPGEPSRASAKDQSGGSGVRDDAGGKHESCFLRRIVNRSQQAAPCESSPTGLGIHRDLAHPRQIDHQAAIACAEACKAMPSATNCSQNSYRRGGADCVLHIAYICATRNEAWCASYHAIPNALRLFVAAVRRAQQVSLESPVERRVKFQAGFDHYVFSLQNVPLTRE